MPMLITATAAPPVDLGKRIDRTSGQDPLASVSDAAPSVMESPSVTITRVFAGASTCRPDTRYTWSKVSPPPLTVACRWRRA